MAKDVKRALMLAKDAASNRARFLEGSKTPPVLYHGTHADILSFKKKRNAHLGFHFGDVEAATNRLEDTADRAPWDKADLAERAKNSDGLFDKWKQAQDALRRKNTDVPHQELVDALENNQDIGAVFKKYEYVPTPEEAANVARLEQDYKKSQMPIFKFGEGANIGKYHVAIKKPLRMPDVKNWGSLKEIKKHLPFGTEARTHGELIEDLRARGYDGIVYQNMVENPVMRTDSYIAFDPKQIKSATGNRGTYDPNEADINKAAGGSATKRALMIARNQRALLRRIANIYPGPGGGMDPSPGGGGYSGPGGGKYIGPSRYADGGPVPPFKLHSGAAKIIGAKGQKKATPQQYAAMPGIKPDELKHSKFDTLGSKALPREEVIKHLEDNALPLEETQLGGEGRNTSTKFEDKTLPGGKNYREVLLHTPVKTGAEGNAAAAFAKSMNEKYGFRWIREMSDDESRQYDHLIASQDAAHHEPERDNYKSTHWEEPNVVAHARMSDRVGPKGEKILHLEESQSDWGQQGRDQGFARDPEDLKQATKARDDYVAGLPARVRAEIDRRIEKARSAGTPVDTVTADQIVEELTQDPFGAARFLGETDKHNEMRNAAMPSRDLKPQIPRGPYVDNTQKWTDLALKRVLHEAAHGGYDKIVVTPGDEQNKRYDLSSQVKNITYFPDIGYLHATTHDNQGIDHDDVKPEDLSKHIGKEAADRILKQGMQRHEGRGKLGGEFYHELEGDGLKMGGAGMRGYYDNILPKRLQALAQQHDPQAKVNLHDSFQDAPTTVANTIITRQRAPMTLHSLDVTPQMRDSIKSNGFSSFKRGGEVGDDPIKDWQWRPVEDVRNELQLDEIPSHVHKFGEFMDETARRAATQGLTPRDLIKAYAITRSSIGRGALPVATVRRPKNPEYGFDALPKGLQGTLRPEGAMGHWLHTKMGQRYLDEAEAGRVDEEAVRDAIKSMGAFGLPDTAEGKALRWAPKNLPGQEGRVSELIARAHRGQSSPEEWRGEMRVPGIAESKAGFFASMLGRGDQPTLDARQIILNTGQSTKKAAPHLSPKGAKEAAVNRLADRQTELGLKHDKSMSPFYQHLAHHAVWDKVGNEETTHDDLMQALRGAKDGGRQGYTHGGRGHNGGPPLDDAGPKKKKEKPLSLIAGHPVLRGDHPVAQGLLQGLPPEAELQELLRSAGIVRPYKQASQDDIAQALKIAQRYAMPLGVGSKNDPSAYYNVKQPVAARDVTTRATETEGHLLKPENPLSWQQFGNIGKGGHVINLSGDRTRFGTLHEINDKPLNWPVRVYAGPDYIREPNKGMVWASASPVIKNMNKLVRELSKKGPVFGMYSPYGGAGGDFAHHMFDAVMAQVNPDQISDAAKTKFDDAVRGGHFIMGQTDKIKAKRSRVAERMASWPGINNPKAASEFARTNMTGDQRKAVLEYLDKSSWIGEGFPHVGMTRVAVTDPKLLGVPENMIGGNVARLEPSDKMLESGHTTFDAGQGGEYVGTLPFAQRHYALPVSSNHFLRTPSAGKGVYVDPYSLNDKAREGYRTLYERNYVPEPVSQRMVEGAEEGIAKMPLYGFKKSGGRAGYAPGGGVDQLLQNLKGSFSNLNQQVAAQAPQQQAPANYQAMAQQATGEAPDAAYRRAVEQATLGRGYESLFPKAPTPAAPTTAAAPAAQAAAPVEPTAQPGNAANNYSSWMTEILGGGGDGGSFKRGGRTNNMVERALAVTRRK